jgi:predicted 2-oxoglutarate/Fe(II)-dependent dioxygenase YbiX
MICSIQFGINVQLSGVLNADNNWAKNPVPHQLADETNADKYVPLSASVSQAVAFPSDKTNLTILTNQTKTADAANYYWVEKMLRSLQEKNLLSEEEVARGIDKLKQIFIEMPDFRR